MWRRLIGRSPSATGGRSPLRDAPRRNILSLALIVAISASGIRADEPGPPEWELAAKRVRVAKAAAAKAAVVGAAVRLLLSLRMAVPFASGELSAVV